MSELLRAERVSRELKGPAPVTLVRDVDLRIARGEFISIQGPSGSGKSSLLYLLGLLDTPSSGRIWLDGVDTAALDDDQLAALRLTKLGFVFQFHFLLAEFSVLDNVRLPMDRLGKLPLPARRERAEALLARLGLGDHLRRTPDRLSGGQRQRVAIARALANQPLLILADEPTGNLDSAAGANVRELLGEIAHQDGCAVVAVTHDAAFARASDRVIHLVDGRISDDH